MTKFKGQEVREAFDGPTVNHDELIDHIEARAREEHARKSDASESGAKTSEFIEETGMNSQALSWLGSIVKKLPKKNGQSKAMDIIRSLKHGLPMIEAHVAGQGTIEMELGEAESDAGNPVSEAEPEEVAADAEVDPETEEFNAEVDAAVGDGTVTPIDFGGAA